jgi:hypothetical protein
MLGRKEGAHARARLRMRVGDRSAMRLFLLQQNLTARCACSSAVSYDESRPLITAANRSAQDGRPRGRHARARVTALSIRIP